MTDLKTKIENRATELQMAYDNARFAVINLNDAIAKLQKEIEDQQRIIRLCRKRAQE